MAKVVSPFIIPMQGVSQQDPIITPDGYTREQINMISDAVKGLYRRPGTEIKRSYPKTNKTFIKIIEYKQVDYEIILSRDETEAKWNLKITNINTGILTEDLEITNTDFVQYLDSIEDVNDLLLVQILDNLYITSRKIELGISQEDSMARLTFEVTNGEILGYPVGFSVDIYRHEETTPQTFTIEPPALTTDRSVETVLTIYNNVINAEIGKFIAQTLYEMDTGTIVLRFLPNTRAIFTIIEPNIIPALTYEMIDTTSLTALDPEASDAYVIMDFGLNPVFPEYLEYRCGVYNEHQGPFIAFGEEATTYMDMVQPLLDSIDYLGGYINIIDLGDGKVKIEAPPNFAYFEVGVYGATFTPITVTQHDPKEEIVTTLSEAYDSTPRMYFKRKVTFNLLDTPPYSIPEITFHMKLNQDPQNWINWATISFTPPTPADSSDFSITLNSIKDTLTQYLEENRIGLSPYYFSNQYEFTQDETSLTLFVYHGNFIDISLDFPLIDFMSIQNAYTSVHVDLTSCPLVYNWVDKDVKRFQMQFSRISDSVFGITEQILKRPIKDITAYQNRLLILTDQALFASKIGTYDIFDPDDPNIMLEGDPIILQIASAGDQLEYLISFNNSIIIFGRYEQYTIFHNGLFTFQTLTILPSTKYNIAKAQPQRAGSEVFFAGQNNKFSKIWKYIVQPDTQINTALDLTQVVPKYIPKNIQEMLYLDSVDLLVVLSKETPNTLYILNQYYQGSQQVQLAWHKWVFSYPIVGIEKDSRDLLYIIFNMGVTLLVTQLDLISDKPKFYLDLWETQNVSFNNSNRLYVLKDTKGNYLEGTETDFTYTGIPFESYIELFPWYLKNSNGQPMTDGRVQLKQIEIIFNDTWYFKIINTPLGRPEYYREYQNLTLDGYEIPGGYDQETLEFIKESTGVLKTYIGGQAEKARLKITSGDSIWRMGITGYTFYGNWQQFSKWSHGTSMGNGGV